MGRRDIRLYGVGVMKIFISVDEENKRLFHRGVTS